MNTDSRTNSIAVEPIAHAFEADVTGADMLRAAGLTGLCRLRSAKASHAEREQARLATELGEDNPQVVQLKTEAAANQRFVRELGAEIDRAKAQPPVVDKRDWTLHGYVRNQDLEGQPELTVALFDRAGRWVDILGHACTNSRGYFQLRYQPADDTGAARQASSAANIQQQKLVIGVSNQKQEVVHRDSRSVVVQPGEVEYREIILGGETAVCSPPAKPTASPTAPSSTQGESPTALPKRPKAERANPPKPKA